VPTRKLVVSTYLQYILIAVGALLLVVFVRQLSGVLLTFLLAAVLAYVLNPLVRRLEQLRVPRVLAVMVIFVGLTLAVVAALLVLIIPAVGQAQTLIQNPEALIERLNGLVARARELPTWANESPGSTRRRSWALSRATLPPPGRYSREPRGLSAGSSAYSVPRSTSC
jgi:predicted PurR-regulated permease PerM